MVPTKSRKALRQPARRSEGGYRVLRQRVKARLHAGDREVNLLARDVQQRDKIVRRAARINLHAASAPTRNARKQPQVKPSRGAQALRVADEGQVVDGHDEWAAREQRRDECEFMHEVEAAKLKRLHGLLPQDARHRAFRIQARTAHCEVWGGGRLAATDERREVPIGGGLRQMREELVDIAMYPRASIAFRMGEQVRVKRDSRSRQNWKRGSSRTIF